MLDVFQNIAIAFLTFMVFRMSRLIMLQKEVQTKLHQLVKVVFSWQLKKQQ